MPSHLISAWNRLALYCDPQSCRRRPGRRPCRSRRCGPGRPGVPAPAPPSGRPSSRRDSRRRPRRSGRWPRRTSTSPPLSSRTATRPCPRPLGADPPAVAPVSAGTSLPHRWQQAIHPTASPGRVRGARRERWTKAMMGVRIPSGAPAPVAPLPPQVSPRSVTFSMARSVTFSMAIDIERRKMARWRRPGSEQEPSWVSVWAL